jgi:hypothetical protein
LEFVAHQLVDPSNPIPQIQPEHADNNEQPENPSNWWDSTGNDQEFDFTRVENSTGNIDDEFSSSRVENEGAFNDDFNPTDGLVSFT